jgi:hypothetical protein
MEALSVDTIALELANEGVPLGVIARATRISSELLRKRLRDAKIEGQLIDLPRDDWPPGFPRDQRAMHLARLATRSRPELSVVVARIFGLSPVGTGLILDLLRRDYINKNSIIGIAAKCVDVHIHHLRRRLKSYRIAMETVWGVGYRIPAADRHRAMDMILRAAGQVGLECP